VRGEAAANGLRGYPPRAPFPLFYHIFYHFGELNQRFLKFAAMNLKKLVSWKARKRSSRSHLHNCLYLLSFNIFAPCLDIHQTGRFSTG
jgi:hypothetical protein